MLKREEGGSGIDDTASHHLSLATHVWKRGSKKQQFSFRVRVENEKDKEKLYLSKTQDSCCKLVFGKKN